MIITKTEPGAGPGSPTTVRIKVHDPVSGTWVDRDILAGPTNTPGLYVTPEFLSEHGLTGYFHITHGPSGLRVPLPGEYGGIDAATARRVADELGSTPLDWTADMPTVKGQFADKAIADLIVAAIKRGMYPTGDVDRDDDKAKPVGPGNWPKTVGQATAAQFAGYYAKSALDRYALNWLLMKRGDGDDAGKRAWVENAASMIAEYTVVYLLRVLAARDPDAADSAARDLWDACDAGDSFGEWLAEWGREYGIPVPEEATEVPDVEIPAPIAFERVLEMPLAYPDNGTVGTLREQIARLAYKGQQRHGELADLMIASTREDAASDVGLQATFGEEQRDEFHIAHGCTFFGWSLLSVLSWLAREYPHLAVRAARMVDDIGTNGGAPYTEDIKFPPSSGEGPFGELALTAGPAGDTDPDVDPGEEVAAAVMADVGIAGSDDEDATADAVWR